MRSKVTTLDPEPPRSPVIEPAFYVADTPSFDTFLHIVDHLITRGARVTGLAEVGHAGDLDELADPRYDGVDSFPVSSRADLVTLWRDTGRAPVRITLADAGPASSGRLVGLDVLPIPDAAVGHDRHPIALACDGRLFEPDTAPAARHPTAMAILELFTSTIEVLRPSYGAIQGEYPLPCPTQIAEEPSGFEFGDCYLSARYLGSDTLTRLADEIPAAHLRPLADGALILTTSAYGTPAEDTYAVRRKIGQALASVDVGHIT
jgi:hypothetical protein